MYESIRLMLEHVGLVVALVMLFGFGVAPIVAAIWWRIKRPGPSRPSALIRALDFVPTPRLRKKLTKLVADQGRHITVLRRKKRYKAAAWIVFVTWVTFGMYIATAPLNALASVLRGQSDSTDKDS